MFAIRKFGLQHCDLPTSLENAAFFMKVVTLKINLQDKKPVPIIFYFLTIFTGACYFYVYLVSMSWFVFCRCPVTGDLLAALVVLSLGFASEISTVKFMYILIKIKKVQTMVAEFLSCDSHVVPGSRFSHNLLHILRQAKKRAILFWIIICMNGLIYCIKPLVIPGRHFTEDLFVLYGLEPMQETPNYQIASILFAGAAFFACYLPASITAFLIVVTGYIEAQMFSLSEELLHLWEDAEEYYYTTQQPISVLDKNNNFNLKNKAINVFIEKRLKEIIKMHGRNIDLLDKVKDIFSGAIAFEFLLLVVALIAELLGGLENTYMQIPFAMVQVGMDCFTGQRVMDASMRFEMAVYNSKWDNYNGADSLGHKLD